MGGGELFHSEGKSIAEKHRVKVRNPSPLEGDNSAYATAVVSRFNFSDW